MTEHMAESWVHWRDLIQQIQVADRPITKDELRAKGQFAGFPLEALSQE